MIEFLISISPYVISVLTAFATYLKVCSDRKKTSGIRDSDTVLVNYKISKLENRVNDYGSKLDNVISILTDIRIELARKEDISPK